MCGGRRSRDHVLAVVAVAAALLHGRKLQEVHRAVRLPPPPPPPPP
jgi:hypothetical protein